MSILVTRPSPAGEELVSRLRTLGQVAWHFPLIEFSPGRQLPQLADQLAALGESDLLFALSQHAVAFAQSQLHQQDRKWPRLPDYFAIGRTTALALHTVSGQKILYPQDREISEVLLQLPELQNIAGKRALILRGNGGRELIGDTLTVRVATLTPDSLRFEECVCLHIPDTEHPAALVREAVIPYRQRVCLAREGVYRFSVTPLRTVRGVEAAGIHLTEMH